MVGGRLFGLSTRNRGEYFLLDTASSARVWSSTPRQAEDAAIVRAGDVVESRSRTMESCWWGAYPAHSFRNCGAIRWRMPLHGPRRSSPGESHLRQRRVHPGTLDNQLILGERSRHAERSHPRDRPDHCARRAAWRPASPHNRQPPGRSGKPSRKPLSPRASNRSSASITSRSRLNRFPDHPAPYPLRPGRRLHRRG